MRSAALLTLVAWRLLLVASTPTRETLSSSAHREPLSNIELLIPLVVSEQDGSYQRAQDMPRPDDDMPYSGIPADAFTLDDDIRVPPAPGPPAPRAPRAPRGSRKRDRSRSHAVGPRPRSLYLQDDSGERERERLWRACDRLGRAAGDALLYLCRELLDLAEPGPAPAPSLAPRACPCCGADVALPWLRRDLMPLGDNSYMVERYMNMQRKRPPPPWLTDP